MENNISLTKLGAWAGSITAIIALLWLIGEPALEGYVDSHINTYEERRSEEEKAKNSDKIPFRHLLGGKMEVADDEVHIELGRMYQNEGVLKHKIDSLQIRIISLDRKIKSLETKSAQNYNEIGLNYADIKKINKKLEKHGLFH
jgi:hypothetical protein